MAAIVMRPKRAWRQPRKPSGECMHLQQTAWTLGGLFALLAVFLILQFVHLLGVMQWSDRRTRGLDYYGLSHRGRLRFRWWLQFHAALLTPILSLLSRTTRFQIRQGTFRYRGVAGPKAGACSEQTFQRASAYQPTAEDVFVVTQMRCGTTWMQHLVFQTLTRGARNLAQEDLPLNAVSPWLESHSGIPLDIAPQVGDERPSRIIKTHLPASLCPFSSRAKYIYVMRHPVSCFASCVDFVCGNLRGFQPDHEQFLEWYRSPDWMWWNTWVQHVRGWWELCKTTATSCGCASRI